MKRGGACAKDKRVRSGERERKLLFSCALFSARGASLPVTLLLLLPFLYLTQPSSPPSSFFLTPFSQRAKLFLTPFDT